LKKLYLPPHIEFEELEVDPVMELTTNSVSQTSGDGTDPKPGGGGSNTMSLDVGFDMVGVQAESSDGYNDFLVNE
jgi:hypothetical protein